MADQDDPELERLFTVLYKDLNEYEAAEVNKQILEAWHRADTKGAEILLQDGIRTMHAGDLDGAIETFTALIELDPDFAEAWNKRATAHYYAGSLTKSVADVRKTLELEPRHFGALSGLGMIYEQLGDIDAAIKAYRRALDVNPHMQRVRGKLERLEDETANDL